MAVPVQPLPALLQRIPSDATDESLKALHRRAVERVIDYSRTQLDRTLTLDEMARVAFISPFHFIRVFNKVTGIPPGRFRSVMRLETAKRLLLTTDMSVIDISLEVGYNSLGTFTRRFTDLIGLAPLQLRRLARRGFDLPASALMKHLPITNDACDGAELRGCIRSSSDNGGFVFVGLFPTPVAQGAPVSCSIQESLGPFHLRGIPEGTYYLLGAAVSLMADSVEHLLQGTTVRGVDRTGPLLVRGNTVFGNANLHLRPPRVTDPPILVALVPQLLKVLAPNGNGSK